MATENAAPIRSLIEGFFRLDVYKRSQGRVTRQLTFAALFVTLLLGVWRLSELPWLWLSFPAGWIKHVVVGTLLLLSTWVSFRLVNYAKFADFLIAVEAEMAKVSWPSRSELIRSSAVVMFTIFSLAALILVYDVIWLNIFQWLGIR